MLELTLDIGEQGRGAEPEQIGSQPALTELFFHQDEPVERLFRLADPAGGFEPDGVAGALVVVADLARHDHADGGVAFTDSLPVDVLMKSAPAIMATWLARATF